MVLYPIIKTPNVKSTKKILRKLCSLKKAKSISNFMNERLSPRRIKTNKLLLKTQMKSNKNNRLLYPPNSMIQPSANKKPKSRQAIIWKQYMKYDNIIFLSYLPPLKPIDYIHLCIFVHIFMICSTLYNIYSKIRT